MNEIKVSLIVVACAFIGAAVACALMLWGAGFMLPFSGSSTYGYCNVLKVPVYGTILTVRTDSGEAEVPQESEPMPTLYPTYEAATFSTEVEDMIRVASQDPNVKGFLIDIDSYGGTPVASNEIAQAIQKSGKPSAAVVHEAATSGGYLVAASTDLIFANVESMLGSIGVTSSYLDHAERNKKEGLTYNQLSSVPFKDYGSPDKPLTQAERELLMRDINISHENFVHNVASLRQLPVERVAALADGSSMLGEAALQAGLIDAIGGTDDALAYLSEAIGEPAVICW